MTGGRSRTTWAGNARLSVPVAFKKCHFPEGQYWNRTRKGAAFPPRHLIRSMSTSSTEARQDGEEPVAPVNSDGNAPPPAAVAAASDQGEQPNGEAATETKVTDGQTPKSSSPSNIEIKEKSFSNRLDVLPRPAAATTATATPEDTTDSDARWMGMLLGLLDFQQRHHGSLNVPRGYRWNNKNLYEWVRNNRKHYLNGIRGRSPALLPCRIQKLQEIGFELDPTGAQGQNDAIDDVQWCSMFNGLVDFRRRFNSFNVSTGYMCENHSLQDWLKHQRQRYVSSMLSEARIDRLQSIGVNLDPNSSLIDIRSDEERFNVMLQGLQLHFQTHGNFVIDPHVTHDGRNLASWAHNQRRLYANYLRNHEPKLLPIQVQLLQHIEFIMASKSWVSAGAKRPDSENHDPLRQKKRRLVHSPFAGGSPVLYQYAVTSKAERESIPTVALSMASQALALYQRLKEQDNCVGPQQE
ncbi:hypothetical protein MPSEU_000046100 [Mayamaea pseudoterrestris]|nr:hypothetical protein MPSEU_000046100 [Mayamaea pseudoterrestris]